MLRSMEKLITNVVRLYQGLTVHLRRALWRLCVVSFALLSNTEIFKP